ncbi:MAG: membrane protein insertase YidC [Acidobacteria bacterium]|nr:membrane protein insertase YidC [Acidobacteriota bacterium]MBI3485168.1 membrane protein insertase YidC [Acidobacteriota bacterium]
MKELSTERRVALAFALWIVIMVGWSYVWKPSRPATAPAPQPSAPASTAPATEQKPAPGKPAGTPAVAATKTKMEAAPAPVPKAAAQEKTVVIENGLYRVEISNRGGVVKSWRLKNYKDNKKQPLELVNAEAAQQVGAWPFSLAVDDPALEAQVNGALFEMTPGEGPLHAPAEIAFEWSDGRVQVSKRLKFDASYVVAVESSLLVDGKPVAHGVAWRGGFGDATEYAHADQVKVIFRENQKLKVLEAKKLGVPDHSEQRLRQIGTMEYAGIEDRYFVAAFLPRSENPALWNAGMSLWHWRLEREVGEGDKRAKEAVVEMAAGTTVDGPVAFRVYVGPKALDELRAQKPPLTELVQFGWLGFIAEPLFYFLRWIYGYVPNYGWAIILMTIGINMALFPLKVKSWRSMQKMQTVMPEIKQIQDRFKKYGMRDPRRQEMNNEVMAVYKREGINPMGSCLPMLLQMPIWIALFSMLGAAIELRHAPWLGWVRDLSTHDPYYILPVLMTVTMYISQKMTPATSADPAQQKMMQMMPLIFGFLFMRTSSGLTLYILSSNIVAMGQQWYLNKTTPPKLGTEEKKGGKKSGDGAKG